jgi:hypothetical protein
MLRKSRPDFERAWRREGRCRVINTCTANEQGKGVDGGALSRSSEQGRSGAVNPPCRTQRLHVGVRATQPALLLCLGVADSRVPCFFEVLARTCDVVSSTVRGQARRVWQARVFMRGVLLRSPAAAEQCPRDTLAFK